MCRPIQHFNVIPHSATRFGSHEPSSGTSCYINLKKKKTGTSEHAIIQLIRQLSNEQHHGTTRTQQGCHRQSCFRAYKDTMNYT